MSPSADVWCQVPTGSSVEKRTNAAHCVGHAKLYDCCAGVVKLQQRLGCGVQVRIPRCDEGDESYSADAMARSAVQRDESRAAPAGAALQQSGSPPAW